MESPSPPPPPPPRLLAQLARGVDGLAVRPFRGGGATASATLAVATSAHGGNVWDGELCLLDAATGAVGARLPQRNSVTAVAWTRAGHVCVAGDGGDVTVYGGSGGGSGDAATAAPLAHVASLNFHDDAVSAVSGVPGAPAHVVVASWDGCLSLWDLTAPRLPSAVADGHHAGPIHALAVHPSTLAGGAPRGGSGGVVVASGGDDCRVHVAVLGGGGGSGGGAAPGHSGWSSGGLRTRHRVTSLAWACAAAPDAAGAEGGDSAVGGNGSHLLVGLEDGAVHAYDLRALRLEPACGWGAARRMHAPVFSLPRHSAGVRSLAVGWAHDRGPGGGAALALLCASGGDDGVIRLSPLAAAPWAAGGQRIAAHHDFVRALAWGAPQPDGDGATGTPLWSGGWDGAVWEHCVR